jgi:hypothetical protein
MSIDARWDKSASQYVDMYRHGLLVKEWHAARQALIKKFTRSLKEDRKMFSEFFIPAEREYGDRFDWELREALQQ